MENRTSKSTIERLSSTVDFISNKLPPQFKREADCQVNISKRGRRGPAGPRGLKGARGATGKEGPTGKGNEVLEIVEKQIDDIHHELDVQMKRIAQLQLQLDELRDLVRRALPAASTP
jgi:hypothetical protein